MLREVVLEMEANCFSCRFIQYSDSLEVGEENPICILHNDKAILNEKKEYCDGWEIDRMVFEDTVPRLYNVTQKEKRVDACDISWCFNSEQIPS